ncbi:MAG TPA: KEOPS complex kinase/ATPase Bud32 [Nitrososphaerales archaeon]|nr:KEOPS complex kinase/ATPase Bud32 [Nitrososphaerales archaeon]
MKSPGDVDYASGKLIYCGAEADILQGKWQGLDVVYKVRKPLKYRLPILDETIRHHRTLREAEMIHQAKEAGVESPLLYHVDPASATLVMEFVKGDRLRDVIGRIPSKELAEDFFMFGRDVARLHRAGIMHGDLTTANVVRRGEGLVFIDFGLSLRSERLEDHAVDIRLIKETVVGAHSGVASAALEGLYKGYSAVVGEARFRQLQKQLQNIERRGRYARVA